MPGLLEIRGKLGIAQHKNLFSLTRIRSIHVDVTALLLVVVVRGGVIVIVVSSVCRHAATGKDWPNVDALQIENVIGMMKHFSA